MCLIGTVIFNPIYVNLPEYNLKKALRAYLQSLLIRLNVSIVDISRLDERFTLIELSGDDAEVAARYLEKVFGRKISHNELVVGWEYSGRVKDILGGRIVIDVGTEEQTCAKVSVSSLLSRIFRKNPRNLEPKINEIIKIMGLERNIPFVVKITSATDKDHIVGTPGRRTLNMFREWFKDRLDRVVVTGVLRAHLDKIVRRTGLSKKIVRIDRIGFLEYAIVCKFNAFADEVAQTLRNSGLRGTAIFMPRKIRKLIEQKLTDKSIEQ